jgi:hypothetical protein
MAFIRTSDAKGSILRRKLDVARVVTRRWPGVVSWFDRFTPAPHGPIGCAAFQAGPLLMSITDSPARGDGVGARPFVPTR